MVVVAIVGILAGGVIVVVNPGARLASARDATRKSDANQINSAIIRYFVGNGKYPNYGNCSVDWCNSQDTASPWISQLVDSAELKRVPTDPVNQWGPPELRYYYVTDGSGGDYCLQVGFQTDASGDANYKAYWNGSWKLRYGPSGPNGGLCQSR